MAGNNDLTFNTRATANAHAAMANMHRLAQFELGRNKNAGVPKGSPASTSLDAATVAMDKERTKLQ